ncbi:hypothetical protein [Helicobacter apodemus]|uniref:hypothetical protein n=1 Tax=Helicobacter apodemus TaxID=135569 RepID=UPI000A9223F7|nr:hypothetical protein [Helicobacter apodemus]
MKGFRIHKILINLMMRFLWFLAYTFAFLFLLASFIGCAPKPIVKIQTKEVLIPIRCNLELPKKPKEDGSFESHKELSIYYKEVEQIAKDCTRD